MVVDLFLLGLILISIIGIRFYPKDFNQDYLTKEHTTRVNGIFILLVFLSHAIGSIQPEPVSGSILLTMRNFLDQFVVSTFLFYSGYGVYEAIKHKGGGYLKTFPTHRILRTLFHFDITVLCFVVINLIIGQAMSVKEIALSLIGWINIGNSNWYIFCILALYALTYAVFNIFPKNHKYAIAALWATTFFFACFLSLHKSGYWFNTLFTYAAGMTYSYLKDPIERIVMKSNKAYFLSLTLLLLSFIAFRPLIFDNPILRYNLASILFALIVVFLTMKIRLGSKILSFFGSHLFWVYTLQRIPMHILSRTGFAEQHGLWFIVITLAITCILAVIFNKIFSINFKKLIRLPHKKS